MNTASESLDVFCLGHASYDQVFSVPHHPQADEKLVAEHLIGCGGGPAANAAVTVARLGLRAGFGGYLGRDDWGEAHYHELIKEKVNVDWVVRGQSPTPLSVVLVKSDGQRSLINYRGDTQPLSADALDFSLLKTRVLLFDGHEAALSQSVLAQFPKLPSVLDAGSVHDGTLALMNQVSDLVCSEKFACQFAGTPEQALATLAAIHPKVVITLGERGLIWRCGQEQGGLSAPLISAMDTTGAGDAFHGAYAAAVARQLPWQACLEYASVAGALACTGLGARPALPDQQQLQKLLQDTQFRFSAFRSIE